MNTEPAGPAVLEEQLREELAPGLEIVRPLGSATGRRTRVYLAREAGLDRLVVVKVLGPEETSDDTARARFEREARAVAALSHPNVVQLYRYGVLTSGVPYLVMQYVQGRSLAETLAARGRLSPAETRSVLSDLASALDAAHRSGIVHRDIRPGTVLLEEESRRALLNDFGVAGILDTGTSEGPRLTQTGQMLGTPEHMSPEQIRGERLTGGSDIYSLGILGYEILTGEGPYGDRTKQQLLTAHLKEDPRPISFTVAGGDRVLPDLLRRCMAKDPSHRPRARDVNRVLSGEGGIGEAEGLAGFFTNLRERKLLQWVGGAAAMGWGLLELVDQLQGQDLLHPVAYPLALVFVVAGLITTGILAWFHGEKGRQNVTTGERWLLGAVVGAWLAASVAVVLA